MKVPNTPLGVLALRANYLVGNNFSEIFWDSFIMFMQIEYIGRIMNEFLVKCNYLRWRVPKRNQNHATAGGSSLVCVFTVNGKPETHFGFSCTYIYG